jgi:hypothetical protein
MPAEKFWPATAIEGDGTEPALTITWGNEIPGVYINGVYHDRSGLNRLIRVARNARDRSYGRDE